MDTPDDPRERLSAFGNHLIRVHIWLREEMARLRESVELNLERPQFLLAHCLAFCSTLSMHHISEDRVVFPVVARQFPELRPVLEELTRDHHIVDQAMRRLDDLLGRLVAMPEPADARRELQAELDGLAALLESHFSYEEKRLVAALNALG